MKKTELGQALIEAASEALEVERGKKKVRENMISVQPAPEWSKSRIVRLRTEKFGVSQAVFARLLNVSKKAVEAWEQGKNIPGGSSSRLLQIFSDAPRGVVEDVVSGKAESDDDDQDSSNKYLTSHVNTD